MPAIFPLQAKFSRGELGPRLAVRADIEHWQAGLASALNLFVMRQGGARRRSGTVHAGMSAVQGANDIAWLIPFVFSAGQSYLMEFTNFKLRFFALGGQVMSGGVPYEIVTPWPAEDLSGIRFVQAADVVYVVHKNHFPRRLVRYGETNWAIEMPTIFDGPYMPVNREEVTIRPSSTGNIATGGTPYASTYFASNAVYAADKAFDASPTTEWMGSSTETGSGVLSYSFPTAKKVNSYHIQASARVHQFSKTSTTGGAGTVSSYHNTPGFERAPRTWTFEGSNDAVATPSLATNWTILDSQTAQVGWSDAEVRYYEFNNATAYKFYRINMTASNAPEWPISIANLAFGGSGTDAAWITLTLSTTEDVNNGAGWMASDVGRHVRILSDAKWHWFEIDQWISPTAVSAYLRSAPIRLAAVSATRNFRLGAFSITSGYPSAVCFYQERLVYAATISQPQTMWFSVTGDFEDFGTSVPLKPDDAVTITLGDVSPIEWLVESDQVLVGTQGNVRPIGAADKSEGFSAANFSQGKPIKVGVGHVDPVSVGEATIFADRTRTSLRELAITDNGTLGAPDIGLLSSHLLKVGVRQMAAVMAPNNIVWVLTDQGKLVAMTYEREQNMLAMTPHSVGGPNAFIESIASIVGSSRGELWLCVRRTRPDGSIVRTIEVLGPDFEDMAIEDAVFLDSSLTYSGAATNVISGLSHLAGQPVEVLADGAHYVGAVSGDGSFTLPGAAMATKVHIGFPYTSRLKSLPMAQGFGDGTALGRKRMIRGLLAHFLETVSVKVNGGGRDYYTLVKDGALFTGSQEIRPLNSSWDKEAQATLEMTKPFPATILAITPILDAEP